MLEHRANAASALETFTQHLLGICSIPGIVLGAGTQILSQPLGLGSQEINTYSLPYRPMRIFLVTHWLFASAFIY